MSQITKEIDYQAFYDFMVQAHEKNPNIMVAETLKQFQAKDVYVSEYDRAIYELEKNGYLNDSIQADAQRKTLGASF